ncbi:hypothetical protein KM043_000072 [Ampulex compressa]|nr:hypothetical protein KM043_000072 [Ampulex compressa]
MGSHRAGQAAASSSEPLLRLERKMITDRFLCSPISGRWADGHSPFQAHVRRWILRVRTRRGRRLSDARRAEEEGKEAKQGTGQEPHHGTRPTADREDEEDQDQEEDQER